MNNVKYRDVVYGKETLTGGEVYKINSELYIVTKTYNEETDLIEFNAHSLANGIRWSESISVATPFIKKMDFDEHIFNEDEEYRFIGECVIEVIPKAFQGGC